MTRRRRRAVAVGAAVAACAVALPNGAGARPAQEDDLTAPERLTLMAQTPWVAPQGTFELTVDVADLDDGEAVRVSVRDRVRNRTEFLTTLDGDGVRRELVAPEVRIEGDTATAGVAGADLPREGVYPVVVTVEDAEGEVADRLVTHLLRLDDPDPTAVPLGVALVVPLHAEPAHTTVGEVDGSVLASMRSTIGSLAAHPDLAVTIVPTPESVDALAATDAATTSALAGIVDGSQVVGGPWVRLDPGSWARASMSTDDQDDAGADALRAALGEAGDRSTWIAPPGSSRPSIAAAVGAGAVHVVVDGADLEPADTAAFPRTLTRPFELALDDEDETVPALAADPTLGAHHDETDDAALAANRVLADLAVLALDEPSGRRVAVLALDAGAASDTAFIDVLLAGLEPPEPITPPPAETPPATDTTLPGETTTTTAPPQPIVPTPLVVAETVEAAFAAVTPAGADGGADEDDPLVRTALDDGPAPSLGALPNELRAADERLASFRTVFGPDDPTAAAIEVVLRTAASADIDDERRRALIAGVDEARDADLAGIAGPPNQRVTLTDRTGVVQLVLTNTTGRPADVTLRVRSDRLEVRNDPDGQLPIRLDGPATRFDLRLRARTSGDAPVDLVLTSPDGRIVFGESRITVRTTAVSGVGLVLMGTAAGFLVLWWSRTIIRERRARHREPAHARRAD